MGRQWIRSRKLTSIPIPNHKVGVIPGCGTESMAVSLGNRHRHFRSVPLQILDHQLRGSKQVRFSLVVRRPSHQKIDGTTESDDDQRQD
jgi:hypothetical protein